MRITPRVFEAFLHCPTKCWLRAAGEVTAGNAYAEWVASRNDSYRAEGLERLLADRRDGEFAVAPAVETLKSAAWLLATDVAVRAPDIETCVAAIERVASAGRGLAAQFIPIRFAWMNKLGRHDKLSLAFDALALGEALGRDVSAGRIVHGDNHDTLNVKLPAWVTEARKLVKNIAVLLSNPTPPDLVLNRHCAECEFQARCRQKAVEKDDLSLLAGMSPKERQKLRSKGIFAVTQLSYTFRVRRRCKRWKSQQPHYSQALKALAVREQKIHLIGRPKIELDGTPVYLDVEGTDDGFYYLIGCRVNAQNHSFWAENRSHERTALEDFFKFLASVSNPMLIFYGRYEHRFLSAMRERYEDLFAGLPVAAEERAVVLLSGNRILPLSSSAPGAWIID